MPLKLHKKTLFGFAHILKEITYFCHFFSLSRAHEIKKPTFQKSEKEKSVLKLVEPRK